MTGSERDGEQPIRVVFFGTPEFAVPALTILSQEEDTEVLLAVTQPDRPAGRKRRVQAPPVKLAADAMGVPILQPESLRDAWIHDRLQASRADVFIVAAFGRIFGRKTLALPRLGCLNLHASVLPAYRGASPITAAILEGDEVTGVSLMKMERGLDTGPVLAAIEEPIHSDDTTTSLTRRLADRAALLLKRNLRPYVAGVLAAVPQPSDATVTRPLVKEDGRIDWNSPATTIECQVRAMWPWPRAWTTVTAGGMETVMQVHAARVQHVAGTGSDSAGRLALTDGGLVVACSSGALTLDLVQLPGGRPQPFSAVARSLGLVPGSMLGSGTPPLARPPLVRPVNT